MGINTVIEHYRGYKIYEANAYAKTAFKVDYEYVHEDYDIDDDRHGYAISVNHAKEMIDDLENSK